MHGNGIARAQKRIQQVIYIRVINIKSRTMLQITASSSHLKLAKEMSSFGYFSSEDDIVANTPCKKKLITVRKSLLQIKLTMVLKRKRQFSKLIVNWVGWKRSRTNRQFHVDRTDMKLRGLETGYSTKTIHSGNSLWTERRSEDW